MYQLLVSESDSISCCGKKVSGTYFPLTASPGGTLYASIKFERIDVARNLLHELCHFAIDILRSRQEVGNGNDTIVEEEICEKVSLEFVKLIDKHKNDIVS